MSILLKNYINSCLKNNGHPKLQSEREYFLVLKLYRNERPIPNIKYLDRYILLTKYALTFQRKYNGKAYETDIPGVVRPEECKDRGDGRLGKWSAEGREQGKEKEENRAAPESGNREVRSPSYENDETTPLGPAVEAFLMRMVNGPKRPPRLRVVRNDPRPELPKVPRTDEHATFAEWADSYEESDWKDPA